MILASTLRLGQGGMEMHKSLWALWAIGVVASVIAASWRWQIERQYKTVALVVDGNEIRTLQVLTGKPLGSVLKDLRLRCDGCICFRRIAFGLGQQGKSQS